MLQDTKHINRFAVKYAKYTHLAPNFTDQKVTGLCGSTISNANLAGESNCGSHVLLGCLPQKL